MITINATFIWLAAIIVFLIVEAAVPGLVSIWFALGSLAAFISAMFNSPIWLQVVWFFVVSILALVITRPLARKYVNSRVKATNADMVIGQKCEVTETVDNLKGTGAAVVGGKVWTARSDDGRIITKGEFATVLRIEGVKIIIK